MSTRRGFIKCCTLILIVAIWAAGTMAKSCLWKVTSEKGVLYLQGSIHVLKADCYPLAPAIEEAYAASETLLLEADMKEMASPETTQYIMTKRMLPGNGTLQQILDADTYRELGAACERAGLPVAAIAKFKPWYAATTLTMAQLQKMGFDAQYGLDNYFFGRAEADGRKVAGLESVTFQIDLLDTLSNENPSDFVARALAELALLEKEEVKLEQAWKTGDIGAIDVLITQGFEGYPHYYETFILDRNKRWLKTLTDLLKSSGTHMAVVGVGHLPGTGGLLELLKKRGYTLEQL